MLPLKSKILDASKWLYASAHRARACARAACNACRRQVAGSRRLSQNLPKQKRLFSQVPAIVRSA